MRATFAISVSALCAFSVANAAPLQQAKVSQVIQDVRLLRSNAGERAAAVNDEVQSDTAVRTGVDSRAELTFTNLTITRLGANTIFSFNARTREINVTHGSILLEVPPKGAPAKITTAAVTAAVTGGTALFGTGPPVKFMVLEGIGTFYPIGHPEDAVTLHGGEMVLLTADGHLTQPQKFDVKTVLETSPLITDFPELANLPLILAVMDRQLADQSGATSSSSPPPNNNIDVTSLNTTANPNVNGSGPGPTGPPSEFGPPTTITSPDPYVITSGTQINTGPTIATNGITDLGKLYRGTTLDGSPPEFLFGEAPTAFDQMVFSGSQNNLPIAIFKFAHLQLTGDPTVTVPSGGTTNLALISVGDITSGAPGGTLTFAGIARLDFITQNGSINLGSEIAFANFDHVEMYARGATSNLTLGSAVTNVSVVKLYAGGTIQVNGDESVGDFDAIAGANFLAGTGRITANNIDIQSLGDLNIDSSLFPNPLELGGSVNFKAANTLNLTIVGGGVFGWDTLTTESGTLNVIGNATFDFTSSSSVTLNAGAGGINADLVTFSGHNLTLSSGGDIHIFAAITPLDGDFPFLDGSISAGGAFSAGGDVYTGSVSAGTTITMGGFLNVGNVLAGSDINVDDGITVVGGSIVSTTGSIYTAGNLRIQVAAVGFGNITAAGDITAVNIFTPGDPCVVMAGGTIRALSVVTGTLQAGQDIFIGDSAVSSNGVVANTITAGGTLTLTNIGSITPNNASFGGGDGGTFHDFMLTVSSIASSGPTFAILSANGGDASDSGTSNPGNGGNITINITSGGLTIGDGNDFNAIQSKGGAFNSTGPFGGGNGGTVDITAAGDVLIQNRATDHAGITATSGTVFDVTSQYAGAGGTVNITSTGGQITVDGNVKVSSDDAGQNGATGAGRESASGGNVDLQSNLTSGTGITVTSNGGLFSFLNLNALNAGGTPGSITLSTMGADIVVNGYVRADFGTLTLDQNDPAGSTPVITIDGGTVQAATFNINGSGDLTIGPNNSTAINIFGGTWNVAHDITLNAANTTFAYSFALNATAGDAINFTGGNSGSPATLAFPLSGDTTFTAGVGGINAPFVAITNSGANLNLISAGSITAYSIIHPGSASGTIAANGGALTLTGDLTSGNVSALTTIDIGGNIIVSSLTATNGTITIGGRLAAFGSVSAGGDITADTVAVPNITTPGVLTAGSGGIKPFVFSTDPSFPAQGAKAPHVFTVDSIVSPNGIDFSGNQFGGIDGYSSGGILTVNVSSANFDPSSGIGIVNFNGADAGATDFSGNVFTTVGGDGGTFIVNATGDITVNSGSTISATTGQIDPNLSNATSSGAGGAVTLNSTNGEVSVDSTIQVSSAEPTSTAAPFRASSSGGNITITSGKSSGVAINVTNSAQLLSALSAAAPGPGGTITIQATGASSEADVAGTIHADKGTIDIEHSGDDGKIYIATGATDSIDMRGNVIKVSAFGANGVLQIGAGTISADTLLRLYVPSSNGTLDFVASCTLSSGTEMDLAAGTITINSGVTVTIAGTGGMANIFTDNPNYNFTPGMGYTGPPPNMSNGSFTGNGAKDPVPLSSAPTFGASNAAASATRANSATSINVTNSGQLLSMLSTQTPNGKVTSPTSTRAQRQTSRTSNQASVVSKDPGIVSKSDAANSQISRSPGTP